MLNHKQTYIKFFYSFLQCNSLLFLVQILYIAFKPVHFINAAGAYKPIILTTLWYLIIQYMLYILLSCIQTMQLLALHKIFKRANDQLLLWVFIPTTVLTITANAYYFGNSTLGFLIRNNIMPYTPLLITIMIISAILSIVLTINILFALLYKKIHYICLGVFITIISYCYYANKAVILPIQSTKHILSSPNIILIGIDLVSPVHISHKNTPFLYNLLKQGTYFTNVISPLARTAPAWMSIMTGLYPEHHHAIENLMDPALLANNKSILWQLKALGYQSLFAIDERRFNHLNHHAGFDHVLGPKIGVYDFLFGNLYDFPLTNLLSKLGLGPWLTPYNYLNRASYFLYDPVDFDEKLYQSITKFNQQKPIFLAVHYTLAHWPYVWEQYEPNLMHHLSNFKKFSTERIQQHQLALHKIEHSIKYLLDNLKQLHKLDNSLVVIFSDHGETFYEPYSRQIDPAYYTGHTLPALHRYLNLIAKAKSTTSHVFTRSFGHGADLLSPNQYLCLLSMQIFKNGQPIQYARTIKRRVSLIDIAPTIHAFLHLPNITQFDGINLLPVILSSNIQPIIRAFIMQTAIILSVKLNKHNIQNILMQSYDLKDKPLRILIKHDLPNSAADQHSIGIIYKQWLLALYKKTAHNFFPILINLHTHQWTNDISSVLFQQAPSLSLLQQLQDFYHIHIINHIVQS